MKLRHKTFMFSIVYLLLVLFSMFGFAGCQKAEYVEVVAKEATCTEDGNISYYIHEKLGKRYYLKKGTDYVQTSLENVIIKAKGHEKGEPLRIYEDRVDGIDMSGLFSCKNCSEIYCDSIEKGDIDIPILRIFGDLSEVSKENKVKVEASYTSDYVDFDCDATLKVQGGTSVGYAKKNYNIQLYQKGTNYNTKSKVRLQENWIKASKYTLKANWVDYSQARNVVSAQIYNEIVHTYCGVEQLTQLSNGGVIDGFPVVLYVNGEFVGLYTFNYAKDEYLFGMKGDEDTKQAILMCNDWTRQGGLWTLLDDELSGFEIEYCSTDDTTWIIDSFNQFIGFLLSAAKEEFKANINEYTDLDCVINSLLYTWVIRANDNVAKNILWITYDGVRWIPSMYDMDGTWGVNYDGSPLDYSELWIETKGTLLAKRVWDNFQEEIAVRYFEFRERVLSISNIEHYFSTFFSKIPSLVKEAETRKWHEVPNQNGNNYEQIMDYCYKYFPLLDDYFSEIINKNLN